MRQRSAAGSVARRAVENHGGTKNSKLGERSALPHPFKFRRRILRKQFQPRTPNLPVARVKSKSEIRLNRRNCFRNSVISEQRLYPLRAKLVRLDNFFFRGLFARICKLSFRFSHRQCRKREQYAIFESCDAFVAFRGFYPLASARAFCCVATRLGR